MRQAVLCVTVCALLGSVALVAGREPKRARGPRANAGEFVRQLLSAGDPPLTSYRARRVLEASTRGGSMHARLVAWTSLDPIEGFRYQIVEEEGSSTIRSKVLRAALEAERTMTQRGEGVRGALTEDNYRFVPMEGVEEGLVTVALRPKRKDTMLVDGALLVTADTADLVQLEGDLVKRPSFWTRRVTVTRRYERLTGVRVPVEMRSVASVLIVGRSTFSMTYEYESVNGIPLSDVDAVVRQVPPIDATDSVISTARLAPVDWCGREPAAR